MLAERSTVKKGATMHAKPYEEKKICFVMVQRRGAGNNEGKKPTSLILLINEVHGKIDEKEMSLDPQNVRITYADAAAAATTQEARLPLHHQQMGFLSV